MIAENLLKDIKKGFICWPVASDEAYRSCDNPDKVDFVECCISFGYYLILNRYDEIFKKSCYHLGFINKEELDDWLYGGFRPSEEKLPKRLVLCFSANWRHETVVCADAWCNKKTGSMKTPGTNLKANHNREKPKNCI